MLFVTYPSPFLCFLAICSMNNALGVHGVLAVNTYKLPPHDTIVSLPLCCAHLL